MSNVRHSSASERWGSPNQLVAIGRSVLGAARRGLAPIYVDPFTEPEFNQRIQAARILTGVRGLDGYADRWIDVPMCPRADWILAKMKAGQISAGIADGSGPNDYTAFVNPPSKEDDDGRADGSTVKNAWRLLDAYHSQLWLGGGAIWVAFNLNQLQTLQLGTGRSPLHGDFLRCIPDRRQSFVPHSTSDKSGDQPSHPCFFVLLPAIDPVVAAEQARLFESMAGELGEVF